MDVWNEAKNIKNLKHEIRNMKNKPPKSALLLQMFSTYQIKIFFFTVMVGVILMLVIYRNLLYEQNSPPIWHMNPDTIHVSLPIHENNCIVHYIVNDKNFNFTLHNFISVMSAIRFLKPRQIMFHAVTWPWEESYWLRVIRQVSPKVVLKKVTYDVTAFKLGIKLNEHYKESITKLSILKNHGGIMLTLDRVVLQSIDMLGGELFELPRGFTRALLSNALMRSPKNSQFVNEWYKSVTDATSLGALAKRLIKYPRELAKRYRNVSIITNMQKSVMQTLSPVHILEPVSLNYSSPVGGIIRYVLYNKTATNRISRFVPRLVYFFWNQTRRVDLTFAEFMSIKSAYRFYKPKKIIFYIGPGLESPVGFHWTRTLELEQFEVVNLESTEFLSQSMEDVKVSILEHHGGIFLNLSAIAVNDIEFLRGFDGVVSFDGKHYGNEFIMMKPGYKYSLVVQSLQRFSRGTGPRERVLTTADTECWIGVCQIQTKKSIAEEPKTTCDINTLFYIKPDTSIANSYKSIGIQSLRSIFGQAVRLSLNGFGDVVNPNLFVVPNIIHYVWFGKERALSIVHLISIYSAYIMQNPEKIYIHYDNFPVGPWWDKVQQVVPIIQMVKKVAPSSINGKPINRYIEHRTDVARLETLRKYGGIYLDSDVFVLRSVDPLRMRPYTAGKETAHGGLASCIILASSDSEFLHMFYNSYRTDYKDNRWAYNAIIVPFRLSLNARPDKIFIGPSNRMVQPGYENCHLLFGENSYRYWKDNYFIHLYGRKCGNKAMHIWETAMYSHPYNTSLVGKISQHFFERFQNDLSRSPK